MINKLLHFIAVHFLFTPSPNIGIYQLAHYQCSVDHIDVKITWLVNGTAPTNDITQLGVGSTNSSLTILGYSQYNNTEVECNAFGIVKGSGYVNSSVAILRIQGNTLSNIHRCFNR